ncbi:S24 family peptidase [Bacteroides sp.]|uniref:S24 family peptidase n=1 Tax=Bacteroides sp. TaxID=29523 RepID=UPI00258293A6|nr:S24 family peptidase [Bacteroides sp.]
MNETIFDRITLLVNKLCNGKNTELASITGVNEANIRNYRNGVMPKADFLEKIVRNFDINPDWLLTGEGSMLRTDEKTNNTPIAHHTEDPHEGIPLLPVDAMAGAFTGEQQVLEYECERYVVPAFKGADFLIPVKGVSMHPRFSSGDIVACKRLSMDNVFFQWNKVYVIDTDQGPLIKRLKPGSDKEHVLVVSDNTAYDPFELAISSIYHLALVIGVIRLE